MGSASWVPETISLITFSITFSLHWYLPLIYWESWVNLLSSWVLLTSKECGLSHPDSLSGIGFKKSVWNALDLFLVISR